MKSYYQEGVLDQIATPLEGALSVQGEYREYAFSSEVTPAKNLDQIKAMPYGALTYLDKVIDASAKDGLAVVWIITDNIEDTGSTEAGNTERFYEKLRGDSVQRVTIFPLRVSPGKPGLVVYALLLDPALGESYERGIADFRTKARGVLHTDALRMKPLERDTVQVSFYKAPVSSRGSEKTYETGVPIKETVEIRFKSKFDHLQIIDSAIKVTESRPRFQEGSLLTPERRSVDVTPNRVRSLGPGDETEQVYTVTIDLGQLSLRKSPAAWWRAAWGKPTEEARLDVQFVIEVPQENFRLRPRFLAEFSARTVPEARATGKAYAIDRLPTLMSGKLTRIQVESPLLFRVKYPAWPAVMWICLFLVGGAAIVGLILLIRRLMPTFERNWSVSAEGPGGYPLQAKVDQKVVYVEGDRIGRIEKNQFWPENGLQLEKGVDRLRIETGVRMHARATRREFDLIFSEEQGQVSGASNARGKEPETPVRRR
jgi:hypothetical protein